MNDSTSMGLTVKVGSGFLIRSTIIAVLCLVLGLWGIYDYVIAIPAQSQQYQRAEVARQFNRIAQPILDGGTDSVATESLDGFREAVVADLKDEPDRTLADEVAGLQSIATAAGKNMQLGELARLLATTVKRREEAADSTPEAKQTTTWLKTVGGMTVIAQAPTTVSGTPVDGLKVLHSAAERALSVWGDVQPPSKFDRPIQWLFILCLPFVPWYAWTAVVASRRRYRLDASGTLHLPEGAWSKDDIADIDMSRWMAKSKAWVVHADGTRVLLDDYVFKGLSKIIGAMAHERYPDTWTAEARLVKKSSATAEDASPDEGDEEPPAPSGETGKQSSPDDEDSG